MASIETDSGGRTFEQRKYRFEIGKRLCRVWSRYNMPTASRGDEASLANRSRTRIGYTRLAACGLAPVFLQAQFRGGCSPERHQQTLPHSASATGVRIT